MRAWAPVGVDCNVAAPVAPNGGRPGETAWHADQANRLGSPVHAGGRGPGEDGTGGKGGGP